MEKFPLARVTDMPSVGQSRSKIKVTWTRRISNRRRIIIAADMFDSGVWLSVCVCGILLA